MPMEQSYGMMGHPGVGLVAMLIIGLIAGYIAEKATNSSHGLVTNVLVGIAGAFVGGKIGELIGVPMMGGFFRTLIVATLGAILVLYVWRKIRT
jgi:uncharacterized membrane protein YeaQ/YmgE (transglycosylase-associated protein family)